MRDDNRRRNLSNRRGRDNIPSEVERFGNADFKRFYKKNKHLYDKKKEARYDFYFELLEDLPEVINFFCQRGHVQNPNIQEAKSKCYKHFLDAGDKDRFVKFLTKIVKENGRNGFENQEYLPIILKEMIQAIIDYNANREKEAPSMAPPDNLFALSEEILKKRRKKFKEEGIDQSLTFDLLSVMPVPKAVNYSPYFRAKGVFEILYKYGESLNINVDKIFTLLFNEDDFNILIGYALQEKKDRQRSFNEKQKGLWMSITKWVFDVLEDMDSRDIYDILKNYIIVRKKDAAAGKDGNRRYYLSSLPESEYPMICRAINQLKSNDSEAEKYL